MTAESKALWQATERTHDAFCAKTRRQMDRICEMLIDRIHQSTPTGREGMAATWEACFRLALRGECSEEICEAKLQAIYRES